jgi:CheY-like chemotaxis protein
MFSILDEIQPLVLVVEDERTSVETRVELFEAKGFAAIAALSKKDAERELRACPSIDLLITDINLDPTGAWDDSGIDLARQVRQIRPQLPIIGYSGRVNDLSDEDRALFQSFHLKGKELDHINEWRDLAVEHRRSRSEATSQLAERLAGQTPAHETGYNLLREFVPGGRALNENDERCIEDILRDNGYQLKIIEPADTPAGAASEGVEIASPISVWLRHSNNYVIAEAYQCPELYATGGDQETAIEMLLLLMAGYHADFNDDPEMDLSPNMINLRNYLNRIFKK